jgi:hypothetical protein
VQCENDYLLLVIVIYNSYSLSAVPLLEAIASVSVLFNASLQRTVAFILKTATRLTAHFAHIRVFLLVIFNALWL